MWDMKPINIPQRKYYSEDKMPKTFRWPKPLMRRMEQEAKDLGLPLSELISMVLDLWLQQQDEKGKS